MPGDGSDTDTRLCRNGAGSGANGLLNRIRGPAGPSSGTLCPAARDCTASPTTTKSNAARKQANDPRSPCFLSLQIIFPDGWLMDRMLRRGSVFTQRQFFLAQIA
ncbi:hypothetical protein LBMAG46_28540 [Planctomycetia bacterium]|nr:hypothetical protein LBMAG46_28540 [Planctomycetia bacterium]